MRLLVLEDDRALAAALGDGLGAQGFAVDVATCAADGRAAMRLAAYDAMVLDLGLPDEDGLEFLRDLRARGDATPVLVLTARGEVSDRVSGLDAGADDYLQKPFAFPELLARVRALLRRSGPVVPPVLRVADLELDAARFRATRRGVVIPLTAKEFAILEYFMRHAGQLVTRTMLLDECWDASYEGISNLVDVHVGRIRRKLEASGGPTLLHTIRGAGFVLDEQPR
jgi:DNA-binding response OmpR family regulator